MNAKRMRLLTLSILLCSLFCIVSWSVKVAAHEDFNVTDVFLKADDGNMTGKCPLTVRFGGYITTNGPGTVRYTFTRSDGATTAAYTLDFKEAGMQAVSTDWTLGANYEGWKAIKVLSPNEMESSHTTGAFVLNCGGTQLPQSTPTPTPQPTPQPTPPTCRLYGELGTASDGTSGTSVCCTGDASITSVQSRFCEGVSPDPGGGSSERRGSETTIAFVPAWTDDNGPHGARLVMGFNGSGLLNWAISTDQGRTWRDKNSENGGPRGGGVPAPFARFNSFRGDLSVVALPRPGGLAMVTLADARPCTPSPVAPVCPAYPDLVALLVSLDGGETFTTTSIVNDRLGIGTTDQPRVTVDPADGTVWVIWRARFSLTPFLTYVRGGHIGVDGRVSWDINGDGQLVRAPVDYQHARFKVFTRPGALTHTIAVTGPNAAPGITIFSEYRCVRGTSGAIRNSFWQYPLGVYFTVSENNGRTWSDIHSAVDMLQPFALGCIGGVGGRDPSGQLIYSENRIDLARDPRNGSYLVTRAFAVSDPVNNTFIGQRIEVWRRSGTPDARFTQVAVAPWTPANPWQFNASIAAREDGQIAVSYYQTTGATQVVELMAIGSIDGGNPGTWSVPVQLSRNAACSACRVDDRSLGEYDEIVALPVSVTAPRIPGLPPTSQYWPGAFYASWGNGSGRVFAAGFTPPPPER